MNNCEFCDKKGLAVLPVRPAIAPAGAPTPKADAAMLASADSIAVTPASYTLRHLRPGYLYTYDEARKWLHAYVVTEGGYLYKLDPGETAPPKLAFSCAPEKCGTVASCVTIPDVKRATKVWFGFSDVQWTPAVIERHKDAAHRAKHMVCLDVQGWIGSKQHKGAADISQVDKLVAEYAMSATAGKALAFTVGGFKSKAATAQALKDRVPLISPAGGLVLSMPDPAGVLQDISALMQHELDQFVSGNKWQRELATSNGIMMIEAAVRATARRAEEEAAEQEANRQLSQPDLGMLFPSYRKKRLDDIEAIRTVTPAEAKRVADNAWQSYRIKFDENAAKKWRADFDAQLKKLNQDTIEPLARAHMAWVKGPCLLDSLTCNYDRDDVDSGAAYTATVGLCIAGTQDKAGCFELYSQWLRADTFTQENILLNAFTLNNTKTQDEIAKAMKVSLDWRSFPFDALFNGVSTILAKVFKDKADLIGKRLIAPTMGPLVKLMAKAVDGKVRPALVALGLYSGKAFRVVEVHGSKKAFRARLIRELLRASGKPVSPRDMERAVAAELRRMKAAGEDIEGSARKRFLAVIDLEGAKNVPNASHPVQNKILASMILHPDDLEALNLSAWRLALTQPEYGMRANMARGLSEKVAAGMPFVGGLVGALLQYHAMQKLGEDEGKAMAHELSEAQQRHMAGMMALGGTITELTGAGLKKIVPYVPTLAKQLRFGGALLENGGKLIGIAGALVMAVWDLKQAYRNFSEGNSSLLIGAYVTSAAFGFGASAAMVLGATGVGLFLVLGMIAISIFIELNKDNHAQDWLERCYWGRGTTPHYQTVDEELAQLRAAFD